ncbi:ATP-grasp domain-containing protein [Geodermatophilus sp. YIM 151500]|uniref:ATP-grasp domain-containing protein n=1 Tax=Geodermatophilus sp. YIM 151500 TaxID=2984531 RepID=UPI0021E473A3|nr:ATP-grasp domain-containing protein [Geodermatophilus sp. YIM 151500]MCV2492009.1 ATP-grasp domain-containing protein [Geodermatophilus sp. YIM 151500]
MRIHLLAQTSPNPVLTAVMEELGRQHEVAVYDAGTLPAGYGREPGLQEPPDVVLLKSRTPEARRVARTAERAGSLVVNPPDATAATLDRAVMAEALDRAGVPAPRSWSVPALRDLVEDGAAPAWPVVVKSRASYKGDLVRLVHTREELLELLPEWGDEPVVAQEFAVNDGFDVKMWVIGDHLSVARRRSALQSTDKSSDEFLDPADLPEDWIRAGRDAGRALDLQLYGVDVLVSDGRPVVVDVNPFPGFRGARDPADALLRFLATVGTARAVTA